MIDPASGTSEADLRAAIEALESQRVDVVEARISLYRGVGLRVYFEIGQPWVAWLLLAMVVADVALAVTVGSWPIVVIGGGLIAALSVYSTMQIEDWVAAHNARIDTRIRALLAAASEEPR